MSNPDFNPQLDIDGSSIEGQVAQAAGDVTQIQLKNLTFNKTQIIQISVSEIKTRSFKVESPYQGLDFFDRDHQDYFFGRDQFLTGLVNELEKTNLVLLLGASGSGKSSVVRAGLIPWLTKQRDIKLVTFVFTPNQDPFESLYASLLTQNYRQSEVQIIRSGKADSLVQLFHSLKQPTSDWFIFIDQFEELLPTVQNQRHKEFMAGLVEVSRTNLAGIKIMMAMRADFLDRLSPYPEFIKLTDRHRPMLAEMQQDELRLAIEQPAAHHGVIFEQGLVEEIIKDVQGQAGYLPLLQYALDLLWKTEQQTGKLQQDRTLKIATYRALGGIRGALQQRVDQIYTTLSSPEQAATQSIFLKLVGIGGDEGSETDWKPIRRRAHRGEFSDPQEQRVLSQLIDEKLVVSDRQPHTQQSTIELAHEVLLSSWAMLNHWIRDNRQAIALRNRLNDDVVRWQAKKAEDELWSGSKLEQALELRKDTNFNQVLGGFNAAANQFINASLGKRDRQRRRLTAAAIAFPTLIAVAAVTFGWQQQQSKQAVAGVFLAGNRPELIAALPRFHQEAQGIKARAAQSNHEPDIARALSYYRRLRQTSVGLLSLKTQLSPQETTIIQGIAQQSEMALADLITRYRMPQLQQALDRGDFGERLSNTQLIDLDQQYTGALQMTYQILMGEFGAGADFNRDGHLSSTDELQQLPCKTLLELDRQWRAATQRVTKGACGWFGRDSSVFGDPGCAAIAKFDGKTLAYWVFDTDYDYGLERLNACQQSTGLQDQK